MRCLSVCASICHVCRLNKDVFHHQLAKHRTLYIPTATPVTLNRGVECSNIGSNRYSVPIPGYQLMSAAVHDRQLIVIGAVVYHSHNATRE